jgi:hypothetical protein
VRDFLVPYFKIRRAKIGERKIRYYTTLPEWVKIKNAASGDAAFRFSYFKPN